MTVTFGNGFPAEQKALVEQAWNILKTVDAGTGTEQEIVARQWLERAQRQDRWVPA